MKKDTETTKKQSPDVRHLHCTACGVLTVSVGVPLSGKVLHLAITSVFSLNPHVHPLQSHFLGSLYLILELSPSTRFYLLRKPAIVLMPHHTNP
jgi:hypothetical protein